MAKAKNKIPKDMPLTQLIQDFMDAEGWKDEISIDAKERTASLSFDYGDGELSVKGYLEADEARCWLKVFFYNQMTIPEKRYTEACELVNTINQRLNTGRFCALSKGPFQYRQAVDLEGAASPMPVLIANLLEAAMSAFSMWSEEMGAVVFTKTTAKEILAALDNQQSSDSNSVPDEL